MWYQNSVFYQIYTLGFCGAPLNNDGVLQNRIKSVSKWIPQLKKLHIGAVLFNPLFESDAHGYDTRDMAKLDVRLGTKQDFADVCKKIHDADIKIVLDGVFNHVGRGFWAFADLCKNGKSSQYINWFHVNFDGNSNYKDGFWYEGWEGHFELVKLNLENPEVVDYLLSCVGKWITEFDIDGIRLDVAYCLPHNFMRRLRAFTDKKKQDFFLLGEVLHGEYNAYIQPDILHSVTNYECYKGIYSSFNSDNMFEIAHSLNRQFGPENWTLYKGLPLFNFVDNHDVSRIASILTNKNHLEGVYALLVGMPGLFCIYYGSEWGALGSKNDGDAALRISYDEAENNDLSDNIARMCKIWLQSSALKYGTYKQVYLTNKQFIFQRETQQQRILLAINLENAEHTAHFNAEAGMAINLLNNDKVDFGGGFNMKAYGVYILEMEKKA